MCILFMDIVAKEIDYNKEKYLYFELMTYVPTTYRPTI